MKVLVISSYQDSWNAVRPEGELYIGLQKKGVDVTVMTQGDAPFVKRFREGGVNLIDFHPTSKFSNKAVRFIREELIRGQYDILHLYNNKAIVNGIRAAKGLSVKVVTYRGYTGNIHWWEPSSYLTHLNPRVDMVTCVSPAVKEIFDKQVFFDSRKAVVVGKGHHPSWYQDIKAADLSEFGIPANHLVACTVANARRMKGMPYLIKAIQQLPPDLPLHFIFIGKGLDDQPTLKALASSAYKDRVHFTGFRRDVLALVKASDISILASVKGEGLSKVLLESMFLGRPTIMTNIAGNRGLAKDGETALVVKAKSVSALRDAIVKLAKDAWLREVLGRAGNQYVASQYSTQASVNELLAAYENLLQS